MIKRQTPAPKRFSADCTVNAMPTCLGIECFGVPDCYVLCGAVGFECDGVVEAVGVRGEGWFECVWFVEAECYEWVYWDPFLDGRAEGFGPVDWVGGFVQGL